MGKLKIVVFTGAGISAESGISTFRDSGGLWNEYKIEDVATFSGFIKNPQLVLDFYNERRLDIAFADPNVAHLTLAGLEDAYDINIITQNIDDLHERAGSTNVLHLHGEITKMKSVYNGLKLYDYNKEIKVGDLAEDGGQLRPHVVWFGEDVPNMTDAINIVAKADILVIIGTSLQVYPASSLVKYTKVGIPIITIDKEVPDFSNYANDTKERLGIIQASATEGMTTLLKMLKDIG